MRFIAPLRLRAVAPSPARPADAFDRARADATRRPHLLSPGNWLEDRDQAPPLDTTQRVTPKATPASTYETSSSAIGVAAEVPRGSRPVKSMLAAVNFLEAHAPRSSGRSPLGGYDAILPRPVPPVSSYETTYARFHELDPAADARVFPEQADDDRAVGGYPGSPPRATGRARRARLARLLQRQRHSKGFLRRFQTGHQNGRGQERRAGAAHQTRRGVRREERVQRVGRRVRRGTVTKTTFCVSNPSERPPRT